MKIKKYAGFWVRLLAFIIDGILLWIVNVGIGIVIAIISALMNLAMRGSGVIASSVGSLISFGIYIGYYVYMVGSHGQTFGKMIMKIKVQRLDGVKSVGYGTAFLREILGKFISGLVLGFGYLWMVRDGKKQTWHDKIAGTIVVNI